MERTMNFNDSIKTRLIKFDRYFFTLTLISTLFLIKYLFLFLYRLIEEADIVFYSFPKQEESIGMFILLIFIAPIIETWLAQSLPYTLLNKVKYLKERSYLILLISALFFGLNHFYSLFYMVYGFLMGLIFMYGYMARINTDKKTFYLIAISHSVMNLSGIIKSLF